MDQKPIGKKLGRNKPCLCGSGLKYKKCCLLKGVEIRQVSKEVYREEEEEVMARQKIGIAITGDQFGYYLPHIQIAYQGRRKRALYARLIDRPLAETFHEFLIFVFEATMGEEWRAEELVKPKTNRHFIAESYMRYQEWRQATANPEELEKNGKYFAEPDGYTQWLICLAFDLYSLQQTKQLPADVLERLKSNDHQFQGARYEIAIAAIFARAGFSIEFFDEKDPEVQKKKHCEFVAVDPNPDRGIRIAVEAKSRHRPGVLHDQRDRLDEDKRYLKGDIHGLLRDAMEKEVENMPYMIFVDLNAKHTPDLEPQDKPWLKDIFRVVEQNTQSDNAGKANLISITNFSYHYQEQAAAAKSEYLHSIALQPIHPLEKECMDKLLNVLNHYGAVPDLDTIYDQMQFPFSEFS